MEALSAGPAGRARLPRPRATTGPVPFPTPPDARFRALAERAPLGILLSEHGLRLSYVNPALADLLAVSAESLHGLGWLDRVLESSRDDVVRTTLAVLDGCPADLVVGMSCADGRVLRVRLRMAPVDGPDGATGLVATAEDVTDTLRRDEELAYRATRDPLTGLLNRAAFATELADRLRAGVAGALLLVNLDEFRSVNAALGHDAGDRLLVEVAGRLVAGCRHDDVLARLGGDEFAVLCAGNREPAHARAQALRVLERLGRPAVVGGVSLDVSARVGVLAPVGYGGSAVDALRAADVAVQAAKRVGAPRVHCYDGAGDRAREAAARHRLRRRTELAHALRDGAVRVHYQAIVDLVTGRPLGAEALARWTPPGRPPVPPAEFVPLAESAGLVDELGRTVVRQVCADLARLRAAGAVGDGWAVSVNLSPLQLADEGLPAFLADRLAEHALPGSALCLEITESTLAGDTAGSLARLCRLADLGCRLSLDDFGTGYSALAHLPQLPLAELKLDRAFVADIDGDSGPIAAAVAAMAGTLGLHVVAEGVETERQRQRLLRLGYRRGQGYLFHRPGPGLAAAVAAVGRHADG